MSLDKLIGNSVELNRMLLEQTLNKAFDHGRNSALEHVAELINYPALWDTEIYPELDDAIKYLNREADEPRL